MESNWRWNVYKYGMANWNWRLCARSLEDPDLALVAVEPVGAHYAEVWYVADPDQLPIQVGIRPVNPNLEHFPYGELVEPD